MNVLHVGAHDKLIFNYYTNINVSTLKFHNVLRKGGVDFHYKNDQRFDGHLFYVTPIQKSAFKWTLELRQILKSGHYDIIHLHIGWASVFGLMANFGLGTKVVIHNHNLNPKKTLFVDDKKENTDIAEQLGLQVWNLQVGKEDVIELFDKKII